MNPARPEMVPITVPITLEDQAGKTKLTWRMLFESAAVWDKVKLFVPAANEQNFDRLEAQLAKMSTG